MSLIYQIFQITFVYQTVKISTEQGAEKLTPTEPHVVLASFFFDSINQMDLG